MNPKKTNVLHLISSLEIGGAEKLLIDLLKNTESNNVNFTVVVMNNYVNEDLKTELLEANHNVHFLNRKQSSKNLKYIFMLLNIIKNHKIQIIHSHTYGNKMWSILCKIFNPKIKLVHTVHDTNIISGLNKINFIIHKVFIDMNIAISKAVERECFQYNIDKVVQIYNGIDLNKFRFIKKQKEDFVEFKIINISRINHVKKGQDILIKALKICKDKGLKFKCDFVGGIYYYGKNSFEYLKNLIEELDLEKEITFLGNRTDICELLSESDLFILPSRYEGLGLVVLEAMAVGVPVIASNIDGPAELITSGENGLLFEGENSSDLADQILYLYNNREKMNYFAENAYKYVQDFDISNMCKKYCELYGDLRND